MLILVDLRLVAGTLQSCRFTSWQRLSASILNRSFGRRRNPAEVVVPIMFSLVLRPVSCLCWHGTGDEFFNVDLQCARQGFKCIERRRTFLSFELSDVIPVKAGKFGQPLLGEA